MLARPIEEITALCRVGYHDLSELTRSDLAVNMHVLTTLAEWCWRTDRLVMTTGRFEAAARLCVMLLDLYDRLWRRELIRGLTFNLALTQEQMADHLGLTLVHVNRTLRRLREERIAIVDRGVVMILDLDRLRAVARGLPEPAEVPQDGDQLSDKMHSAASAISCQVVAES